VREPVALALFLLPAAAGLKSDTVFQALNFGCFYYIFSGDIIGYDDMCILICSA